ncbi:MAG TPA: acetyl-CoA carboxylase biotin carboxyl carrier protein [Bauldia sp.]|nr:acetyl-CoA carboxylase biotin carboxyl carrier protein [Bauldia sp.]
MTDKRPIVDKELIRELAELLAETGLSEIEVERGDTRIKVARSFTLTAAAPQYAPPPQAAAAPAAGPAARPEAGSDDASHPGAVLSPMVGTAFRAPEPGKRPYVEVGDRVSEGQTVLIVEAMKTMNQIPAPRAGTVKQIMVEDAQPVEYGEPLMIIE